jgi:hypothetical protein
MGLGVPQMRWPGLILSFFGPLFSIKPGDVDLEAS